MMYGKVAKPLLFKMDAENAHNFIIKGLRMSAHVPGMLPLFKAMYGHLEMEQFAQELWGITFPSPFGLAAGLDKNGEAAAAFSQMGFGFIEVGTVTPLAQPGNEQPRLFRLPSDDALINRMGFNNKGAAAMAAALAALKHRPIPIAVNIGKNKQTANEHAADDYRSCIRQLYAYADLFVINISSPNTPDLRNLQHGDDLTQLLIAIKEEIAIQSKRNGGKEKPVLVKIAPDLSHDELSYTIDMIMQQRISGVIATNTTLDRAGLTDQHQQETGGLSGRPLTSKSTLLIRDIYAITKGQLPIVGVGGIFTAQDAYDKIRAGASIVEVYTALIYQGPSLLRKLQRELLLLLQRDGFTHVKDAVGVDVT